VQLEALASGVPIAAFPVTGPKDVIGNHPIGVLNEDLRAACMQALWISRESCREFALRYSWENSARQFIDHARKIVTGGAAEAEMTIPISEAEPPTAEQTLVPGCNTRVTHEHSV
jgi:hypothetical protein